MNPQVRQKFVAIHVILAGFFLPAAITFAVTGGLYTFGIRGGYDITKHTTRLELPPEPKLSEALQAAEQVLHEIGELDRPSGAAGIKKAGTSWQLEWTGVNFDFVLEPTTELGVYAIAVKKTGIHRFFVQLHKAKGGMPFKIMAGGLAIALVSLFLSGVAIAFSSPQLKRRLYVSAALGFLAYILAAYAS